MFKNPILVFFFIQVSILHDAHSQTKAWDSTYRPPTYDLRVGHFKSYPNHKKDIIFLGNSITLGTEWTELLGNKWVRNRGISGDISYGVLERIAEVTEGKPRKIFILIGINDISRNVPDSLILDNYRKLISHIKTASPRTRIYFQTILPVNNEFPVRNQFNKDDHIAFVNNGLKALAEAEHIILIDLHPHFLDEFNKLDKRYTYDGLHLNAEGYKKWASVLKNGKYLNECYASILFNYYH